jgi:hypothetical protein
MPTPEQFPYWLGAIMFGVLGFLFKHHFNRVDGELKIKADKTEIAELRQELRESRIDRINDMERMERISNERYTDLHNSMNQRINDMERHITARLDTILQHVRNP